MFEKIQQFFSKRQGFQEERLPQEVGSTPKERLEGRTPKHPRETPEEAILESYDKRLSRKLGGGINITQFVELKDDGSGVFKPVEGERGIFGIKAGSLYKRERAAYLVSRFLNLDLVPSTIIRDMGGETGSFQQFIEDADVGLGRSEEKDYRNWLIKLWIFDYIIGNLDRHNRNFLTKDGKLYAIDHGYCFPDSSVSEPFWPYEQYFGIDLPEDLIAAIKRFWSSPDNRSILKDLLDELLSQAEVGAFFQRIELVVKLISDSPKITRL